MTALISFKHKLNSYHGWIVLKSCNKITLCIAFPFKYFLCFLLRLPGLFFDLTGIQYGIKVNKVCIRKLKLALQFVDSTIRVLIAKVSQLKTCAFN